MPSRGSTRPSSVARERPAAPALLRFSGAVERDPAIDEWFDRRPADLASIARAWFMQMRQCGPDIRELVHDGCPVACVEDAPFGYVNVFRAHVDIGSFQGAGLRDPAGLLEGTGRYMRHVKARPGHAIDAPSLGALIAAAYQDIRTRLDRSR